jgi:metal-dependent amidase/aminoacylase/carboxypeptidase family protein
MAGGCRYFKPGGEAEILSKIRRIAEGVARIYDVNIDVATPRASVPPVINTSSAVTRAKELLSNVEGLAADETFPPICASDNYSLYLRKYPGFYGFLGIMNEEKGIVWTQHNSRFDIDEAALRKGYEFMCAYALDFLGPGNGG